MKLLRIGNTVLNLEHLLDADFTPASSGTDEETGEPYIATASLKLRFTVTESDVKTDYNGDLQGVMQDPYFRTYRGAAAESLWERITAEAS